MNFFYPKLYENTEPHNSYEYDFSPVCVHIELMKVFHPTHHSCFLYCVSHIFKFKQTVNMKPHISDEYSFTSVCAHMNI